MACLVSLLVTEGPGCHRPPPVAPPAPDAQVSQAAASRLGLQVVTERAGATIRASFTVDRLLAEATDTLDEASAKTIDDVMDLLHRTLLAGGRGTDFYVLRVRGRERPPAEFYLVGALEDVRRVHGFNIGPEEYHQRLLRSLHFLPPDTPPDAPLPPLKEVELPAFLASQITTRIRHAFDRSPELPARFYFDATDGVFEHERFTFMCAFAPLDPTAPPTVRPDTPRPSGVPPPPLILTDRATDVLQLILTVIADVLHGYAFTAFEAVTVQNLVDGEEVVVQRDELEAFRTGHLTMEHLGLLPHHAAPAEP